MKFVRAHPLAFFFGLTLLFSWSIWVPMGLDRYDLLPARLNPAYVQVGRMLGTFGPAAAAILLSRIIGGKPGTNTFSNGL